MRKIIAVLVLAFLVGCANLKDFKYGLQQINSINSKYKTTMETYPSSLNEIDSMLADFNELKKMQLEKGQESFEYVAEYRILNLEAEKMYIQGQKYGSAGTTTGGFGCKQRPLIIESVSFRNSSALKGFAAVDLVMEFADKHPEEAMLANLSHKNALFLNATFYQISRQARSDSNIINNFCPKNVTLEIYKQSFVKQSFTESNNLSEEYINNLSYEEAVSIYKKYIGIE